LVWPLLCHQRHSNEHLSSGHALQSDLLQHGTNTWQSDLLRNTHVARNFIAPL
jgi:hypothetical protein